MTKYFQLIGILLVLALLAGCTQQGSTQKSVTTSDNSIQQETIVMEDPELSELDALEGELVLPDVPMEDYTQ